ncbi:hypothetical protein ACJJH9_07960 [Microbulbifer sp. DLAB2-AF]|uniref:hypothetical protein n=1 Tax=Microbulbifer sp. DLAB2-AF TaxID=3243395 RepID=UPI00403A5F6F
MHFLFLVLLLLSIANFSTAQERLAQLPADAQPVQILGKTDYQSGNNFYAFSEKGRYYYPVDPPTAIRQYERPRNLSFLSTRTEPGPRLTRGQIAGCMNMAADKANANPAKGGKVYIREYNMCLENTRRLLPNP